MIFYLGWHAGLFQTGRPGRGDTPVSEFYWMMNIFTMPIHAEAKLPTTNEEQS